MKASVCRATAAGLLVVFHVCVAGAQQSNQVKKKVPQLTTEDVLGLKTRQAATVSNNEVRLDRGEKNDEKSSGSRRGRVSSAWFSGADGYAQAERERRRSNAPMAVYFYTDWCPYCKRLDRDILSSNEVDGYLRNVVKVRINPEDGANEEEIAKRYGITGYPSFFIVPAGSAPSRKINPYKREGNGWVPMGPADFVRACEQVAN